MSDTSIAIRVEGGEETLRALGKRETAVRAASRKSLRLSAEVVLARATENVSGRILRVQTGTLRRRLSYQIFKDPDLAKVGSPTVYAPIQEFGGTIQHPGGTAYFFRKNSDLAVFLSNKKAADHPFPRTRPHPITIPARPWLRPALKDSRGDIEAIFRKGAQEALSATPGAGTATP